MAGYPKSILFPQSTTFYEVVAFLANTDRTALVYKLTVLLSVASLPWWIAAAAGMAGGRAAGVAASAALFLIYLWVDFPINYADFGMVSYLLAVPFGVLVTVWLGRYLARGGLGWWLAGALGSALVVLIHLTSALTVVPAAAAAYLAAVLDARRRGEPFPTSRHLGVWLVPLVVLAANAFWWWPGILLASMKGESGFVFAHPEGVAQRLGQIVGLAAPVQSEIQVVLGTLGLAGFWVLAHRDRVAAAGLIALAAAGFGWGYLAGASRSLDFLQPGRQTYALYSALAVGSGVAIADGLARLRRGASGRLDTWAVVGLILIALRVFGPPLQASVGSRLALGAYGRGRAPFLSSEPAPRLTWILEQVRGTLEPGQRLLYEESGFDLPGIPDPYAGGRYSGLLPTMTGVEVLGGPYLHVALLTNFTQFGEGRLFGDDAWGREHFDRYARLYRPDAILCWSPRARAFCRSNPDRVEILADDGTLLFGRVLGFPGKAVEGEAVVDAKPGQLVVQAPGGQLDSEVVLGYHHVPYLEGHPSGDLDGVTLDGDPVPFVRLRPTGGPRTLRLRLAPESWFASPPVAQPPRD